MVNLTEKEVEELLEGATFGAEMEVPNYHTDIDISDLGEYCLEEFEIINERGICNDPKKIYNKIGSEIMVHYTHSEEELIQRIEDIWDRIGRPHITASPTLHIHIRPHKLLEDSNVHLLKHIMQYTYEWAPKLLPIISPLPEMEMFNEDNYPDENLRNKIIDAYRAKYRHRHGKYTEKQIERAMEQDNFVDVINALTVKNKQGRPSWNIHTRGAFNFAKLRESDGQTLEFRMFSLTKEHDEIETLVKFPAEFIKCALMNLDPVEYFKDHKFPPLASKETMDYYAAEHFFFTDGRKLKRKEIIQYLKEKLISREITLSELGYPPFWEKELGDKYEEVLEYSKSLSLL